MRYVLCLMLMFVIAAASAGCSGDKVGKRPEYYRKQLADDLHTPMETKAEVDNRVAHTVIMNERKANAEWLRLLLLDHPSWSMGAPAPYE